MLIADLQEQITRFTDLQDLQELYLLAEAGTQLYPCDMTEQRHSKAQTYCKENCKDGRNLPDYHSERPSAFHTPATSDCISTNYKAVQMGIYEHCESRISTFSAC